MNNYIHGGDVSDILLDFSVNTNPLGIHPDVMRAMEASLHTANRYPEYGACSLKQKLARQHKVSQEQILVTAGASEAFIGICRGLNVKKGAVVDPGFYGYEYALNSIGADIVRYSYEDIAGGKLQFAEDLQVIFLCNPNNPDGRALPTERVSQIIKKAAGQGIYVVLDECFLPLSDIWQDSFIGRISDFKNLIIVRAFTKTFALAGLRLGYLLSSDVFLADKIAASLPEWNVSGLAISAGLEALDHLDYLEKSRQLIRAERSKLIEGLKTLGLTPTESVANFILFKGSAGLKEKLLQKKILIRDCSNYHGLADNSYRIAVLSSDQNNCLLSALKELQNKGE